MDKYSLIIHGIYVIRDFLHHDANLNMKNKWIVLCLFLLGQLVSRAQDRREEAPLPITPAITRQLIDSIGQSLYRNYIFPDTAIKMAGYLKEEFKKGAYAAIK